MLKRSQIFCVKCLIISQAAAACVNGDRSNSKYCLEAIDLNLHFQYHMTCMMYDLVCVTLDYFVLFR